MAVFTMTVYITIYDIQITIQKVITYRCKVMESEILLIYCKRVYRRNASGRSQELLFEKYYCILQNVLQEKCIYCMQVWLYKSKGVSSYV